MTRSVAAKRKAYREAVQIFARIRKARSQSGYALNGDASTSEDYRRIDRFGYDELLRRARAIVAALAPALPNGEGTRPSASAGGGGS